MVGFLTRAVASTLKCLFVNCSAIVMGPFLVATGCLLWHVYCVWVTVAWHSKKYTRLATTRP